MTRLGKRMFIIDMTHGRIMLSSETVVLQANGIPAMDRKGPITKNVHACIIEGIAKKGT